MRPTTTQTTTGFLARRQAMRREMRRRRRGGMTIVVAAAAMVTLLGIASLVIDAGYLLKRKGDARRTADAAALAGALKMNDRTGVNSWYAGQARVLAHGYPVTTAGSGYTYEGRMINSSPIPANQTNTAYGQLNRYEVWVKGAEPVFFGKIFNFYGGQLNNKAVWARAVAEYTSKAPLDISGGGQYGVNGPINLSVFGPEAWHAYGDAYSPRLLNDGSANPQHEPDGYDFSLDIPSNYATVAGTKEIKVQIFDPDCYNKSGVDADGVNNVDEMRDGPNGQPVEATTTQYTLFFDKNNTPNVPEDDVLIGAPVSYGADSTTDMKWVTPTGMQGNIDDIKALSGNNGPWKFRINVKPTNGSSENGFNLRAGPAPSAGMTDAQWNAAYGTDTKITATGRMPMNFNQGGTTTVTLGTVPADAAGGTLTINKFDTDVGSKSVTYRCSGLPGQTFAGVLSDNDAWQADNLSLPANYPGGIWTATYVAGQQDTSVWEMNYSNFSPGQPGKVRLVE